MCSKCFIRKRIELTGSCVPLGRFIEMSRLEFLEPRAKSRKLGGSELFDGLFKVFNSHDRYIAVSAIIEKTGPHRVGARALAASSIRLRQQQRHPRIALRHRPLVGWPAADPLQIGA